MFASYCPPSCPSHQQAPRSPLVLLDNLATQRICFIRDLCMVTLPELPHCQLPLVRQTWYNGYSDYHPLLPERLGRRPHPAGIISWSIGGIWGIVLCGLPPCNNGYTRPLVPTLTQCWTLHLFSHPLVSFFGRQANVQVKQDNATSDMTFNTPALVKHVSLIASR